MHMLNFEVALKFSYLHVSGRLYFREHLIGSFLAGGVVGNQRGVVDTEKSQMQRGEGVKFPPILLICLTNPMRMLRG